MKIVCDACQAKYSISDDKVQGKVFKIRCKKCSNIIVVRGGAGAAEAPPAQEKDTRVFDYGADAAGGGDEAVWHVVINQDQVGPMTAAEVQQRFAAGEIDGETYAWREGFADWLPLSQVDAFASYVASGSTTSAVSNGGGSGAAAVSAMFGGGEEAGTVRSDPGDLFSAASASSSRGNDDDGDLFGSSKPSAATAAQNAANAKLRGERNENSVLFSLNNLAQLASDKPAPSASVSSVPSGHATGAAGGEGSGLIDIRSMANAYLGNAGGGAAKPAASIGSIDDLPVFGGGGFSEPAVIVPTASRQNNNKMMYVLIGSVGFLAVAAVIMVVVLLKGNKNEGSGNQVAANDKDKGTETKPVTDDGAEAKTPDSKAPETKTPETKSDGSAATPDTATKTPDPTETKTPETKAPEAKTPEVKAPETKKPETKKPDTKKPDTKKPPQIATNTKPDTKKPAETPPAKEPAGGGGCDEVSCVLNNYEGACCQKFRKGGTKPAGGTTAKPATGGGGGGGDLPESLDRGMITDGVNKVKARVMGCGDKSSAKGQVKVSVKVSPGGGVTSVSVKATPDPALGNCVAGAMQKATFAKTQNGGSFAYPWNF